MTAGHLDGYRAGVIAFELEVAPADVADAVVAALSGHFGDDSSSLRRRTRVLLSRISPDLVRERAQQARNNTGLRRWVAEPGVDEWHGTFPSEDAASAWAAIDRLAHDLVAAGTCTNIEQARGKALTDLVTGNATIDVQIVLTVPADSQPVPDAPEVTEAAPDRVGSASTALVSNTPAPGPSAVAGSEPTAALPTSLSRSRGPEVSPLRSRAPPSLSTSGLARTGYPHQLGQAARWPTWSLCPSAGKRRRHCPATTGPTRSRCTPRSNRDRSPSTTPPTFKRRVAPLRARLTQSRKQSHPVTRSLRSGPTMTRPRFKTRPAPPKPRLTQNWRQSHELTPSPRPDPTTTWSRCRGADRPSRCSCAAGGCRTT